MEEHKNAVTINLSRDFNALDMPLVYRDQQDRVATNSLLILKQIFLRDGKQQIQYRKCMEEFELDSPVSFHELNGYWTRMRWSQVSKIVHDVFVFLDLEQAVSFMEFWDVKAKTTDRNKLRSQWEELSDMQESQARKDKDESVPAVNCEHEGTKKQPVSTQESQLNTLLNTAHEEIEALKQELESQKELNKKEILRHHEEWANFSTGIKATLDKINVNANEALAEMRELWLDAREYSDTLEASLVNEHCKKPDNLLSFLQSNKLQFTVELIAK